jgi:hypothetical protein
MSSLQRTDSSRISLLLLLFFLLLLTPLCLSVPVLHHSEPEVPPAMRDLHQRTGTVNTKQSYMSIAIAVYLHLIVFQIEQFRQIYLQKM